MGKAGETVLRALRRLGGNQKKRISSADRWKKKKQASASEETEDEKKNKEDLLRLTGLADVCLQNGDFQIYEKSFEQLTYELKKKKLEDQAVGQFNDVVENRNEDEKEEEDDEDDELE